MLIGLTKAPAHFWYIVEDVLKQRKGVDGILPIVVFLDDIAVFSNSNE